METASAGSKLLENYPELHFLLHFSAFTPRDDAFVVEEVEVDLEGVDILYIYGLGQGGPYRSLKNWLKEKRERRLIFIEDDLAAVHALLSSENAEPLLTDPQALLHCILDPKAIDAKLEEVVALYPCDRIEVAATGSKLKKRRFQQIRMKLLRQSAVSHAILTEALYSPKLLGNLLRNISRWQGSFLAGGLKGKFQGIPAVICGAGPSLNASLPLLRELGDRALIIAGGSTIAALSNQGVQPHVGIALDPNPEEFERLKIGSAYEMPLIYATRLQPDVFNALNGERGYLVTATGGPCETYFEKAMGLEDAPVGPELGPEAFSVTTLAIALAVEMGCSPILLNGIDLAYTGGQRYAEGVVPSSFVDMGSAQQQKKSPERLLKRKDIRGHFVHTLVKWVMESECIGAFAKAHPETEFINVSEAGIGFAGIGNQPFAEAAQAKLAASYDLSALVHGEIQQLKMLNLKEKIAREMSEVGESLARLSCIAQEMLDELERIRDKVPFGLASMPTGKMAILEIDFQEEKAFECLFPTLGPALDKLLARAFFIPPQVPEEEKRKIAFEGKMAKWKQWKEMIDNEAALWSGIK